MCKSSSADERLHKYLANMGVASRRTIEKWIAQQKIRIDGNVARLGDKVNSKNRITLHGKPLRANSARPPTRILLYNKPEGEITTRSDPNHRRTVFASLPKLKYGRWVAVGRLDINTRGLLLFTNDGEVANRLMHPRFNLEREYLCRVYGTIQADSIKRLKQGILLDDQVIQFQRVRRQSAAVAALRCQDNANNAKAPISKNAWYSVVIKQGKYREVRRMWRAVDCQLSRLVRVRYGDVVLPKNLKPGQWQELKAAAIAKLMKSTFCHRPTIKNRANEKQKQK